MQHFSSLNKQSLITKIFSRRTYFLSIGFLLFLCLCFSQCTTHSIKYDNPLMHDGLISPLLSVGVADFYANGNTDLRTVVYDKLKNDPQLKAFFTDVFLVHDINDINSDIVIKGEFTFGEVIGDIRPTGAFFSVVTGGLYVAAGLPIFVTRMTFEMDIAVFENGICKKTFHYEDKVSQHRSVYNGKVEMDYRMVLQSALLAWIADVGDMGIYKFL